MSTLRSDALGATLCRTRRLHISARREEAHVRSTPYDPPLPPRVIGFPGDSLAAPRNGLARWCSPTVSLKTDGQSGRKSGGYPHGSALPTTTGHGAPQWARTSLLARLGPVDGRRWEETRPVTSLPGTNLPR